MNFDLKKFRKDFGLKQSDVADIFGISQNFISKIETGKESFPSIHYETLKSKFGEDRIKSYILSESIVSEPNAAYSKNDVINEDDLSHISRLIKTVERLSKNEELNSENVSMMNQNMAMMNENIKELIAQGRQQTENITKLVDFLCNNTSFKSGDFIEFQKGATYTNVKDKVKLTNEESSAASKG